MRAWVAAFVVAVALGTAPPAHPSPGDAAVAKTLLEAGKKAFGARKYEEALALLRKAQAEDPALLEAIAWKAQALEKVKDDAAALAAYREFLDLLSRKEASGGATAEERRQGTAAEKRVEALAFAEREFARLEGKFASDLMALARDRIQKGDPSSALRAAERILAVLPKHPEATALRNGFVEPSEGGPFADVAAWKDYLPGRPFPVDSAVYAEGILTLDTKSGGKLRIQPPVSLGPDFAYEVEFRLLAAHEPAWSAGLCFGETQDGLYTLQAGRSEVSLLQGKVGGAPRTLASIAVAPVEPGAWHRLGIVVRGNRWRIWYDGEGLAEGADDSVVTISGEIGIAQKSSKVERRVLRTGTLR